MKCNNQKCVNGYINPNISLVCKICGSKMEEETFEKFKQQQNKLINELKKTNSSNEILWKELYLLQQNYLLPTHQLFIESLSILLNKAVESQQWQLASLFSKQLIEAYEEIYPNVWPILGLQYLMSSKIDWYLHKTQNTIKWLSKAIPILKITHSHHANVTVAALSLFHEAKAESDFNQNNQ